MTPQQVGINHRALRNAADKVASIGYDGDAHRFVEGLVLSVLADGYRPLDKPEPEPAPTGRGSTEHARRQALIAAEQAVRAAKEARKHPLRETPNA